MNKLMFLLALTAACGFSVCSGISRDVSVRYEEIEKELENASLSKAQKAKLEAEKLNILCVMQNGSADAAVSASAALEVVVPVATRKKPLVTLLNLLEIPEIAPVPVNPLQAEVVSKIGLIFETLVVVPRLADRELASATALRRYFSNKVEKSFGPQGSEVLQKQLVREVSLFAQAAIFMSLNLELVTTNPQLLKDSFGWLPITYVDAPERDGLFIQALRLVQIIVQEHLKNDSMTKNFIETFDSAQLPVEMLGVAKKVADAASFEVLFPGIFTQKKLLGKDPLKGCLSITPGKFPCELYQEFVNFSLQLRSPFGLQQMKNAESLQIFMRSMEKLESNIAREMDNADAGLSKVDGLWLSLLFTKTVLLKREVLARVYVGRERQGGQIYRKVYYKHKTLMDDVEFMATMNDPVLGASARRYQSLVMRFLTGDIGAELDFYFEHHSLMKLVNRYLTHYENQSWFKKQFSNDGKFKGVAEEIVEILELMEQSLSKEPGIFTTTHNLLASLMGVGSNGLFANGLQPEKIGMTVDDLQSLLKDSSRTMKNIVLKLVAENSPTLFGALMTYVNGSSAKEFGKKGKTKKTTASCVTSSIDDGFLEKLEAKAPGLMDVFVQEVKDKMPEVTAAA